MASIVDKFGVYVFPWGSTPPSFRDLTRLAETAESIGLDSLHIPYHLTLPTGWIFKSFGNRKILDAVTLAAALAGKTKRIKIGLNSIVLPLAHPFMWAKSLTTLDIVSEGRSIVGAAIGWWPEEFKITGVDIRKRSAITDEQLAILKELWTRDKVTYDGNFYHLHHVELEPKPIQTPHPPIWIGGGRGSISRASKYADFLMPETPTIDEITNEYIPSLRGAGTKEGRDVRLAVFTYGAIAEDASHFKNTIMPQLTTCMDFEGFLKDKPASFTEEASISGLPAECAEKIGRFLRAGASYFVLDFQFHGLGSIDYAIEQMRLFSKEVLPSV